MESTEPHSRASTSPTRTASGEASDSQREAESWLLVRKTLLQAPKFSKTVEDISDTEWLQSRANSLKILLDSCSNFHGGPRGEMWTTITSVVSYHMGPRHEFLTLISEHQENLWTTCSLVTVETLSEEASLDDKHIWEEDENKISLSVPPVSPHREYGSIELIEPTPKDGRRVCMHHFHWKWLLLYVPLLVALVAVVTAAVTLMEMKPETTRKVETLEATTVYLDTQRSVWYKGWQVSDCSSSSGTLSQIRKNRTAGNIQLIDSDDVVYFEENVVADEVEGYQNTQLLKTLNGPLYLLAGSSVEYQFCLMANFSRPDHPRPQPSSEFLIFNDITSYSNYIRQSGRMGKEAAIFYREMLIGTNGEEEMCTNVTFTVSQADFYYTMYKLPPHVELHYRSKIHVVYLNYTKYVHKEEAECEIVAGGSCDIDIPETTFSSEEYTLLAYIPLQSADIAPNSTQLCVTPKQSILVSVIPGVVSACVLLLLVVILVCQIISFLGNLKRRKGYYCIKPINV